MATKNLVPRADLEGQLGIVSPVLRRWKQINAGTGQFDLLKTDELQNTTGQPLLVAGDTSVSIVREETADGWQYKFTSQGGSGSAVSNKIFQGTGTDEVSVEAISDASNKEIKFSINSSLGWRIDENGHMLPYANNTNNIGSATERVKEVFLMPDALTFANGKINVSSSKRLQFGISSGGSHVYDDISLTKSSVKVATTPNEPHHSTLLYTNSNTLTATSDGHAATIDGITLTQNDRVLVTNRATKAQNGIYTVVNTGSTTERFQLQRASDLNIGADFVGTSVSVLEGTDNGQKVFFVTPPASGGSIVGTHHQNWITFGDSLNTSGVQTTIQNMFDSSNQFLFDSSTGTFQTKLSLNDLADVNVGTPDLDDNNKVLKWDNTTSKFVLGTDNSSMTSADIGTAVGAMVSDNTETGIEVTYQSSDNTLDFVVNLSNVSSTTLNDGANLVRTTENATFGAYTYNFTGSTITVASPTADNHAVSKQYVDNLVSGLKTKSSVRLATTTAADLNEFTYDNTAATLTSSANSLTIDTKTVANGDRILVKDQTIKIQNGIYVVSGVGSAVVLTRTSDLTTSDNAASAYAFVGEGTQNGDKGFVCTSTSPDDVVGADNIEFTAFSSSSQVIAGSGLSKTGQTLSVNVDGTSIKINADNNLEVGEISAGVITSGEIDINLLPTSIQNLTTNQFDNNDINPSSLLTAFNNSNILLHDLDTFIVHDTSAGVTRKASSARILEYITDAFTGEVDFEAKYTVDGLRYIDTTLNTAAIQDRDDKATPVADDYFLISDSADTNKLKKVKLSAITSSALDIDGLSLTNNNDAPLSNNDKLAIYEESSTSNRKITINQLKSTLTGVKSLIFEDITINDTTKVIQPQYHYNLRERAEGSSTYTFIFYDNDTNSSRYKKPIEALPGEIVKISLTANNDTRFYDSPLDPATTAASGEELDRRKVSMTTNVFVELEAENTIKYSQLDLIKPLEFIYTVNYDTAGDEIADSGKWRPYVGSSLHTPHHQHVYNDGTAQAAFSATLWARYRDVYCAVNATSFTWRIPSAKSMFTAGAKHGEYKIIHINLARLKELTFESSENDIIYQSSKDRKDLLYKPKNNSKSFTINNQVGSIPKFKLTFHTYLNNSTGAHSSLKGTRECYWDIDIENGSMSIFPDGTLNGQVLVAAVNSPAVPTSKYLENANIAPEAAIDLSKLAKVSTANRLLGATTANAAITEVQVETDMIKDNAVEVEKIEKIENKKVLGSLLNTGAQSGESNPVTPVNVIDDLAAFVSNITNEHTNLVTAAAVKKFVLDSLDSQAGGDLANARSIYASVNTSDIMTVGDTGRTTSVASGSNTIVGTAQLTIDDVETGVIMRRHDTSGIDYNETVDPIPYPITAMKKALKGNLQVFTGVRTYVGYLMGNVFGPANQHQYQRYNAGTITDATTFSEYTFRNCYRIQLPPAETFFNKYGSTESLTLQMESHNAATTNQGNRAYGMVILPHPNSVSNRLLGTKDLASIPAHAAGDKPYVLIDAYQNGKYFFTDEGNYWYASRTFSSGDSSIQDRYITLSIRISLRNNVPIVTYKPDESSHRILGYAPSAYVWTIRPITPIET